MLSRHAPQDVHPSFSDGAPKAFRILQSAVMEFIEESADGFGVKTSHNTNTVKVKQIDVFH